MDEKADPRADALAEELMEEIRAKINKGFLEVHRQLEMYFQQYT